MGTLGSSHIISTLLARGAQEGELLWDPVSNQPWLAWLARLLSQLRSPWVA